MRNVAIAKQRFDSTADPVAKVALRTLPLATLLAHTASDRRLDKDKRDSATALLQKLDTQFCTAIGVSADWGLVCTWFVRVFDEAYHDIAKSRSEIDCMLETLDAVFVKRGSLPRVSWRSPWRGGPDPRTDGGAVASAPSRWREGWSWIHHS